MISYIYVWANPSNGMHLELNLINPSNLRLRQNAKKIYEFFYKLFPTSKIYNFYNLTSILKLF